MVSTGAFAKARQLLKQGVQIVMVAQQCGFLIKAILIVILKGDGCYTNQYVASLNL